MKKFQHPTIVGPSRVGTDGESNVMTDDDLPPPPKGDMVLDDSNIEADYTMLAAEILKRINQRDPK